MLFDAQGGLVGEHLLEFSIQSDFRPGERGGVVALGVDQCGETRDRLKPRCGDFYSKRGDFIFRGLQPAPVGNAFLQELISISQRLFEAIDARAMIGVDA